MSIYPDGRSPSYWAGKTEKAIQKQQRQISGVSKLVRPGAGSLFDFKAEGSLLGYTGGAETLVNAPPPGNGVYTVYASVKVSGITGFSLAGAVVAVLSGPVGEMEIDRVQIDVGGPSDVYTGQLTILTELGPSLPVLFTWADTFGRSSSDVFWRIAGVRFPRSS